jgi:SAM-dependent methyltransferase
VQAYSVWVLHVVADPALVMHEVRRILRPGGRYLVMDGAPNDDPDDPYVVAMHEIEAGLGIGRRAGRAHLYAEIANDSGLRVVDIVRTGPYPFTTSLRESAERLASRMNSWAWDVPDDVWERVVVPVTDRLASLPGAEEQATHHDYQEILVLER